MESTDWRTASRDAIFTENLDHFWTDCVTRSARTRKVLIPTSIKSLVLLGEGRSSPLRIWAGIFINLLRLRYQSTGRLSEPRKWCGRSKICAPYVNDTLAVRSAKEAPLIMRSSRGVGFQRPRKLRTLDLQGITGCITPSAHKNDRSSGRALENSNLPPLPPPPLLKTQRSKGR
jgi:hypothetical protein